MSGLPEHIEADIITGDDGYRCYWPSGNGFLRAHELREIADRLDELNAGWHQHIREFFDALAAKQEPLGAEFARVWDESAGELYEP